MVGNQGAHHESTEESTDRPRDRWNDFAITPEGHRLVICGIDADRRGFLEIWDLAGGPADPPS